MLSHHRLRLMLAAVIGLLILAMGAQNARATNELRRLPDVASNQRATLRPAGNQDGNTHGAVIDAPLHDEGEQDNLHSLPDWLSQVQVGYDDGFVIASERELDLDTGEFPFQLKINGWSQLRLVTFESNTIENQDQNEFQIQRARIIFSGTGLTPDLEYFVQLDGRSSSGDDLRLLDFYLSFDVGHHWWCIDRGRFGVRAGKYKMPFNLARGQSGRQLQFTDRSVASTFFDVNRSIGGGPYGRLDLAGVPVYWEAAVFNGLITGGAETGSSGQLDDNFAYSCRVFAFPIGEWGDPGLADLWYHETLALRVGAGVANSTINRNGTTEFNTPRVVDSGVTLASILPMAVDEYMVTLYAADFSTKYRGLSVTGEYYMRSINQFVGAAIPDLFDHGYWLQAGYFLVPHKLELLARWSRVVGNSGTLGQRDESSDELSTGLGWYISGHDAKLTFDVTRLNGAPISSSALNIFPGYNGLLFRSQVQISF